MCKVFENHHHLNDLLKLGCLKIFKVGKDFNLGRKNGETVFFLGISSQSTGNGDTTMIFGFLEECRMKKLFPKKFWIFRIFSLLCGAKKSKNLRFGRKNGETGFFLGCQNQEKCQKSKFLFFCTTSF